MDSARKSKWTAVLITAALTSLASVSVEAIWKPFTNYVVDSFITAFSGEQWAGQYNYPSDDEKKRLPVDADVSKVAHRLKDNRWVLSRKANDILSGSFKEKIGGEDVEFKFFGVLHKDNSMLISFRGPGQGKGNFYLIENNQNRYYSGYVMLCDCNAPVAPSIMICPYVLYKEGDSGAAKAAQTDPILLKKCESRVIPS